MTPLSAHLLNLCIQGVNENQHFLTKQLIKQKTQLPSQQTKQLETSSNHMIAMHIIPYHLLLPQTTEYYSTIYIIHSNNHHYIRKINLRFRIQPFWYCRPVIWARQDWPVALDRWLDPSRPWPRRYAFRCWCCRPVTSGLVWQHQRPWWRWFQLKLIFGYFLGSFCEKCYGKGNSLWPRASQHVHVSYMFQSSDWHWNLGPCLPETCMQLNPPSKLNASRDNFWVASSSWLQNQAIHMTFHGPPKSL